MKIQILDKAKKKKFIEGISELGLKKIPQLLIKSGRERVRAFSGNLSKEEIMEIWRITPIEGVGLYVGKDSVDKRNGRREVRLALEGLHAWKDQISENILQLNKEQEIEWFLGKNIEIESSEKKGFVAVRSADGKDFVGIGKIGDEGKMLYGLLPKERRRKEAIIG
jgi:NOL1/NOP2/fmu family ribosome biogenesis protein